MKNQTNSPDKKRIIISKSAKKGTEMVVYHTKTKRGIKSETCHEVVNPKMSHVKKALSA